MSTIDRWNPFREMDAIQNAMNRAIEDNWRNAHSGYARNVLALDVYETDEAYHIQANLPGVEVGQIDVNLHDNVLTIDAEIEQEAVEEDARVLLRERSYGKFNRSVTLPLPVSIDDIEANYEDGILQLSLPKVPEAQPHPIAVKRLANVK